MCTDSTSSRAEIVGVVGAEQGEAELVPTSGSPATS